MKNKYFLLLIVLFSFEFAICQALSTAPTLTFSNNTGISTDNIASDGDGGSVNISDIDIQIYNISDVNGTFQNQLSWENNAFLVSGSSSFSGLTRNVNIGSKGMLIKSVSGSEFKLNKFVYYNWGETSSTIITVKGYKNNVEVALTSFQAYDGGAYIPMTITLTTAFGDVDEVRFYISAGGYVGDQSSTNHTINSIQVSSPILGTNNFELNSKIKIYPNPASTSVNIQLSDLDSAILQVHDCTGKVLINQKLDRLINLINIENLPAGMYLFEINSNQEIQTTKIIKY